jgi:hypothetical protein
MPIPNPPPEHEVIIETESGGRYIAHYDQTFKRWVTQGGIVNLEKDRPARYCEIPKD